MKLLINLSNFGTERWDKKQLEGFDQFVDIRIPALNKLMTAQDVFVVLSPVVEEVKTAIAMLDSEDMAWITIQSEDTVKYLLWESLSPFISMKIPVYIKNVNKLSFVTWREI